MSSTYSSAATGAVANSQTIPSDGDNATAASVDVPFETLSDDVWRVANGARVSASIKKIHVLAYPVNAPGGGTNTPSRWTWVGSPDVACPMGWTQFSVDAVAGHTPDRIAEIVWPILLPHGASITQIDALIAPNGTHTGLPQSMPTMQMFLFDTTVAFGSGQSARSSQVADSSVLATYNTQHTLTILQANMAGANPVVVDRAKPLFVHFIGESGTNALANLTVYYLTVTATIASAAAEAA